MTTADLINREVADLPATLQAEVLDFIGFLKTRHPSAVGSASAAGRVEGLAAFFAPYRRDLSGFAFDRDDANAR